MPCVNFGACEETYNCIDGNGNVVFEERSISQFKSIISEGNFDIEVIQDTVYRIEIEAESNIMVYIRTFVHGSILEIDTRNDICFDNTYPIRVKIYTPQLESASIAGSGNIYVDKLVSNEVYLTISGSGNIEAYIELLKYTPVLLVPGI